MFGQGGGNVDGVALRVVDYQAPRVEVHLAADAAGQERQLPAVFAVAHDRMADRRHVHAQLVGAARQRLEFDPCGAVAGTVDHAIFGFGRCAVFDVDVHLFAAAARLLGQRGFDRALALFGHADDQRPVGLLGRAPGKALGKERCAARRARDQQDARGVLVEPVDQPRAGLVISGEGIEQAIDMIERAAAALRGEARRLVENDCGAILGNHHRLGPRDLFGIERLADAHLFGRRHRGAGRDAQHLPRAHPVSRIGALAIDPDLPGARPAADRGKADLGQVALEPAVEANLIVVRADSESADGVSGCRWRHAESRIAIRPMYSAVTPASTETAA